MRIVYLLSGAGEMICGSCLQGNTAASAILELGEDMILLPIYMPLRTDEPNVAEREVSHGGIVAYLLHSVPVLGRFPRKLLHVFNWRPLLSLAGKFSGATDARKLGALTCSMLRGGDGPMKRELDHLCERLRPLEPDIVHLSNTLLLGMTPHISAKLQVPIVSGLSGEDLFLDQLPQKYREESIELISAHSKELSGLIAMNRYYAERSASFLRIPREKIEVIEPGLNLNGYENLPKKAGSTEKRIGYLARIAPEKGLEKLVDAFILLSERPNLPPIRLLAAGYLSGSQKRYLASIKRKLEAAGISDRFEYIGEPNREEKIRFLSSLDLMSVPAIYPEAKGLSILEAMACGVPCVEPRDGSYPELIESSGGGILVKPNDTESLANGIEELLLDPDRAEELGKRGRESVFENYNAKRTASRTVEYYRSIITQAMKRDA